MKIFDELFNCIYKGNEDAIALSYMLWDIAQVWDDLIDDDEVTKADINMAFLNSLVTVQLNPLWGTDIATAVLNTYLRWSDANAIETNKDSTDNELAKAWMLRAGLYDIFVLLAAKLHGINWATSIGPVVRATYGETLNEFIQEVRNA